MQKEQIMCETSQSTVDRLTTIEYRLQKDSPGPGLEHGIFSNLRSLMHYQLYHPGCIPYV